MESLNPQKVALEDYKAMFALDSAVKANGMAPRI
jgi:hypothetical protein